MAKLSRRSFLKSGFATVIVGGSFRGSLRDALAQVKATGKPLLTIGNLNKLFANGEANKVLAGEVVVDGKGFLIRRFTLTTSQSASLKMVPQKKVLELQNAFKTVAKEGGVIHFHETHITTVDPGNGKTVTTTTPHRSIDVAFSLEPEKVRDSV